MHDAARMKELPLRGQQNLEHRDEQQDREEHGPPSDIVQRSHTHTQDVSNHPCDKGALTLDRGKKALTTREQSVDVGVTRGLIECVDERHAQ
eukprot:CAMPEP_0119329170 /NCGR_PEP_ID=MMETSP1333-20130426/75264_1 /TAXON_ID=418940 /ORGANISM="Scyphosphaera apsteinii, Strain RCC1455" /LENGTH=91 /DNA_ID=CAMNT_0007338227 /DNA_START=125 /DNA_END=400 /DNA_ORIENTATION=+